MDLDRLTLLDAPTNLGLRPADGREPGCRRAPEALRADGLLEALGADDAGAVPAPPYRDEIDATGTRNGERVAAYAVTLADRVGALLDAGRTPVVLGGDCSIVLGDLLALRRRGPAGLLFVDGHLDFRHPGIAPTSAVAGEDLALVTGRGHPALADLEGRGPLVPDEHVVALGNNEWDEESLPARDTALTIRDAAAIRAAGPAATAAEACAVLAARGLEQVWLHLDVDVLDAALMPAVDSPNPGGLRWDELAALLGPLVAAPAVVGMEVTVFDPDLDPDGALARRLVALLVEVLVHRGPREG